VALLFPHKKFTTIIIKSTEKTVLFFWGRFSTKPFYMRAQKKSKAALFSEIFNHHSTKTIENVHVRAPPREL
jgi:hypothetical protein